MALEIGTIEELIDQAVSICIVAMVMGRSLYCRDKAIDQVHPVQTPEDAPPDQPPPQPPPDRYRTTKAS